MRLFAFVAALFRGRDDELENVKERGRETARAFFDGFREEMSAQTSELAVSCRGRTADQLLLECDAPNGDDPPADWTELRAFARERGVKTHGRSKKQILRALAAKPR